MFTFNDALTLTRYHDEVVVDWRSGFPEIFAIAEPAFLSVAVSGITMAGSLYIHGTNASDAQIAETFPYSGSATLLSSNKFKAVAGLTPSWNSFIINVKAANEQGEPVRRSTTYGPFLCSVADQSTFQEEGQTGHPGYMRGSVWRVTVFDIQPLHSDYITTDKGISGYVGDLYPVLLPNWPTGWSFIVTENPG